MKLNEMRPFHCSIELRLNSTIELSTIWSESEATLFERFDQRSGLCKEVVNEVSVRLEWLKRRWWCPTNGGVQIMAFNCWRILLQDGQCFQTLKSNILFGLHQCGLQRADRPKKELGKIWQLISGPFEIWAHPNESVASNFIIRFPFNYFAILAKGFTLLSVRCIL